MAPHPTLQFLLSASEDNSMRIWSTDDDLSLEMTLDFGLGRLWAVATHEGQEETMIAVGGDKGIVVFKIVQVQ